MPQVLNTHKHASETINGVSFTRTKNGMLSQDIPQSMVDYFLKIPGYIAVKAAAIVPPASGKSAETTTAETPAAESGEQQGGGEQEANEAASEANAAKEAAEEAKK